MFAETEMSGKITALMYAKGYGFVKEDESKNSYFFHAQHTRDFELLEVDDVVVFFLREGEEFTNREGVKEINLNAVRVRAIV